MPPKAHRVSRTKQNQRLNKPGVVKRFDADGDGKLNRAERQSARSTFKARRARHAKARGGAVAHTNALTPSGLKLSAFPTTAASAATPSAQAVGAASAEKKAARARKKAERRERKRQKREKRNALLAGIGAPLLNSLGSSDAGKAVGDFIGADLSNLGERASDFFSPRASPAPSDGGGDGGGYAPPASLDFGVPASEGGGESGLLATWNGLPIYGKAAVVGVGVLLAKRFF